MFTVLNGGKALGSKVKFATFYLIIDVQASDENVDAGEIYFKVTGNIKRLIAAHKLGENGFKANAFGSYYNAYDSINDTFKMLEDAINQAQVNTADRKFAQLGVNVDAQSSYLAEQEKYEIEGPKNLFDANTLTEWLFKMATDHPLLTYIEDPFAQGDLIGYQRIVNRFKEKPGVKIAIKNWFGSDLEALKHHTQLIQPDVESDEEEGEAKPESKKETPEKEPPKEEKEEPPVAQKDVKGAKPDPKGKPTMDKKQSMPTGNPVKPGQKGAPVPTIPEETKDPNDPNRDKIRPHAVHFDRSKHQTTAPLLDMIQYTNYQKEEERVGLVIDDFTYESRQSDIIDFAFATQCDYVNLKGIFRPERTAKVERFQEIMETIRFTAELNKQ